MAHVNDSKTLSYFENTRQPGFGEHWQPVFVNTTSMDVYNNTAVGQKDPLVTLMVPAIMFASGVFGNVLALIVLARSSRKHKRTVFYRLVGALALTDLCGTVGTSPVALAVYANKFKWVGGPALCNYFSFMLIFAGFATSFIVGTMAVDRFLAIRLPFFYEVHVSLKRATICIPCVWLLAFFIACLPLFGFGKNEIQYPGTWCFFSVTSPDVEDQIFVYLYSSIGLLVIGLTAVTNIYVICLLLKMRKVARSMGNMTKNYNDSELQMMVLLMGIVIIFSTCYCPLMFRLIINQASLTQPKGRIDLLTIRMASFNQILDPWVYILLRKELLQRAFKLIKENVISRCVCKKFFRRNDYGTCNGQNVQNGARDGEDKYQSQSRPSQKNDEKDALFENHSGGTFPRDSSSLQLLSPEPKTIPKFVQSDDVCLRPKNGGRRRRCSHHHTSCFFCFNDIQKEKSKIFHSRQLDALKLLENSGRRTSSAQVDVFEQVRSKSAEHVGSCCYKEEEEDDNTCTSESEQETEMESKPQEPPNGGNEEIRKMPLKRLCSS